MMARKPTYAELEKRIKELESDLADNKKDEEQIKLQAQLFNALEMAHLGPWEYDVAEDVFTFNDYFYKIFRTTADQVGGYRMSSDAYARCFLPPDERSRVTEEIGKAIETKDPNFSRQLEHRIIYANGTEGYITVRFFIIKDADGKTVKTYGVNQDITERRNIEEALRESQKRYQELADSLSQVIFESDISGNVTYANTFAFSLFGYTQDDFEKGLNILQMLSPDDEKRAFNNIQRVMQGEILEGVEYTARKKDGKTFPAIVYSSLITRKNKPSGLRGILVDLTRIKETEKALRESEEKYRDLVERANDGIIIVKDGILKYANPSIVKLTGYNLDELIGVPFSDFIIPEDREKLIERNNMRINGHDVIPIYETAIKHKNGGRIDIEVNAGIITYEGRPANLVILRDITERKKILARLQHTQKMESIGTLAGGIAHDFNNILSPIIINSEMAMMDTPPDSPVQQNLQQILKAGARAKELVGQILTFARRSEEEKIPLKTSQIVKEVVKLMRSTIPSTIDIQCDFKTVKDIILGDPTQMNQILMNLCTNAAYAMREKGGLLKITLSDEYIESDGREQFLDLDPGHYIRMSVIDSGSGIAPEILNRIFEPYFTTKRPGEGTGMGLALVHGIVNSYNGSVTVESEIGKGTIFHVLLPVIEEEVSFPLEPKIELPEGSERILLVDDEKNIVDIMQSILERLGYEVTARTSSIEALEAFRYKPKAFDLLITDMTMPNMTGKDLAKEIMSIRKYFPVILCTGFSEQIDERKALEMGISAFVMKPVLMKELANTVREVLDKNMRQAYA
ncbi:MAG: PAS domain S-box protein [Deltaproteobacteria bacterium]|nr:PAS domain S-box protein [Deltaproteobacteria bacterium]